jgi:peptidoglycan/xylan/chitin deacetylase (PgdA/CDA1 family)
MKTPYKARLVIKFSNLIYHFLINTKLYNPQGIRVLCYHDITLDNNTGDIFSVNINEFKEQMNFLKKEGYTIISISQFLDIISKKKEYTSKLVLLTFDDGFKSFYSVVLPILKEFKYPATLFLTPQFISKESNYLNWNEVLECSKNNLISIGAHGLSHKKLTEIPVEIAFKEIEESKNVLQNKLRIQIESFAYPYGSYNNEIEQIIQKTDFKLAFTTRIGINHYNTDCFALKRITIFNFDSLMDFKKKLMGAYDWRGLFL